MWYLVEKDGKYFKSNSYVNSSGLCEDFTWVPSMGNAWATSSLEEAQAVASRNGGKPVEYA